MEIKLESSNGKIYKAYQKDHNTFGVLIKGEEYKISLINPMERNVNFPKLTDEQKKKMTKAIFENKDILDQLDSSEQDSEDDDVVDIDELMEIVREANDDYR